MKTNRIKNYEDGCFTVIEKNVFSWILKKTFITTPKHLHCN